MFTRLDFIPVVMSSPAGYQGHFDQVQARSDPFASSESLRAAQILGQNLQPTANLDRTNRLWTFSPSAAVAQ